MKSVQMATRRIRLGYLSICGIVVCLATTSALSASGANAHPPARPSADAIEVVTTRPVPARPVQAPATVTRKGQVAPAVPIVATATRVPTVTIGGIPSVALDAYQRAAQLINASDPTCHLPWELIGGIGRVESDHGQYAGNHLTASGVAVPGIYGPVLDGTHGVGLVRDTDGGRMDHNATYDRAVGPMQFLPGTWALVGARATADGQHGPQNIYDAALATATYLCSGNGNMTNPSELRAAVFRYNHSDAYVALVVGIAQAYGAGGYASIPVAAYVQPATVTSHQATKRTARPTAIAAHPASHSHGPRPSIPTPTPTPTPKPAAGGNPLQSLLTGLTGGSASTPAPTPTLTNAPLSPTQAASYCAANLTGYLDLLGTLHAACKAKLTGLTPAQVAAEWAAHKSDLAAWFMQ